MNPLSTLYQILKILATRRNVARLIVASLFFFFVLAPFLVHGLGLPNLADTALLATLLGAMFASLLSMGKTSLGRRLLWVLGSTVVILLPVYYFTWNAFATLQWSLAIQIFYGLTVLFGFIGAIVGALVPLVIETYRESPRWYRLSLAMFIPLTVLFSFTVGKVLFEPINAFELGSFSLVLAGLVLTRVGIPARLQRYSLGVSAVYFFCGTVLYIAQAYSFPQAWTPPVPYILLPQSGLPPLPNNGIILLGGGLDAGFLTACIVLLVLTVRLAIYSLEEERKGLSTAQEVYR